MLEKKPGGFFSKMAMAFGIGEVIRQGINNAAGHPIRKFRVGNSCYRWQKEMVSISISIRNAEICNILIVDIHLVDC